jgi:hypothetical protein
MFFVAIYFPMMFEGNSIIINSEKTSVSKKNRE